MSLDDFIDEVMSILKTRLDVKEVCVKKVYPLRFAAEGGQEKYDQFFQQRQHAEVTRRGVHVAFRF
jgi:uncharacterized oxidoreductase